MAVKSITFDRFDLGIDLRKGASVSDANRLREMKNAYVTTGLATQKRPGLVKVTTLEPGTRGLFAASGKLHTFYGQGSVTHADTRFEAHKVAHPEGERALKQVWFTDVFDAFIYASVEYQDGTIRHHYLDGSPQTAITDPQCPHTPAVIKAASRIFAVAGDVVRYSAAGRPRDWSSPNNAGALPTGLNARGERNANGLGIYRNELAVLSRDSVQMWALDSDPQAMKLSDVVENVGTSFPRTVTNVSGDLYFLSDFGFRSITTMQYTDRLTHVDIGSPIDVLVRRETQAAQSAPMAYFHYGTGQYLCMMGYQIFVYSISATSKIAAWSRYELPFQVEAFAELGGILYLRNGDDIYRFDENAHDDAGTPIEVLLELPYMDFKTPGQLKRIQGADLVMEGECTFSVAFDVRQSDAFTSPVRIRGNTRSGGKIPVTCAGTAFSLRFHHLSNQPFRLEAVTLYYDVLGAR
ncbi:MAG: hypothetical protein ON057_001787 [Glomeribacter sp. 1016415]|nr:hypothetical protein [Glomeribacter sp. 1016415]